VIRLRKLRIKLKTLGDLLALAVYVFFVVIIVDVMEKVYEWSWWLELAVVFGVTIAGLVIYRILKAFIEVVP